MLLEEYLARKGITQKDFAKKLNIGRPMLNHIVHGKRRMGTETAILVHKVTKGQVTRDEALFPEFYPAWKLK